MLNTIEAMRPSGTVIVPGRSTIRVLGTKGLHIHDVGYNLERER